MLIKYMYVMPDSKHFAGLRLTLIEKWSKFNQTKFIEGKCKALWQGNENSAQMQKTE